MWGEIEVEKFKFKIIFPTWELKKKSRFSRCQLWFGDYIPHIQNVLIVYERWGKINFNIHIKRITNSACDYIRKERTSRSQQDLEKTHVLSSLGFTTSSSVSKKSGKDQTAESECYESPHLDQESVTRQASASCVCQRIGFKTLLLIFKALSGLWPGSDLRSEKSAFSFLCLMYLE